jgi:zinc protease
MRVASVVFLLSLAASLSGCSRAAQPAANANPKIAVEKYALPNGLEVILSEDHRLPMVAVNLWYHVGPANEGPGRTGFAHLFEHMMFQGSKHAEGDSHFKLLEGAGASDYNGTTDYDRTNYYETVPANQLELALWLESDHMGYLLDVLDQKSFAGQQDVVRNERRQSVENQPYGIVDEEEIHLLFPKNHPYYANVIGSHADIQAATLDDVKQFFKTYYRPNNASLAIVGDFDKAKTKALVEKYFGALKRGPEVPKITATTPPITAERRATVADKVPLPRVSMSWITPPAYKPGDADADLAAQILGGGKSSRLYKKLVYELQIAQDVSTYQYSLALGSLFKITATARQGHTAAELEKAIDAELQAFRTNGPTAQELDRARNLLETSIVAGLETLGGVADLLNRYNQYLGTPDYLAQDLARYQAATLESVKTFASTQLASTARVVVEAVPGVQKLAPAVPTPPAATGGDGTGRESLNADEAWRKDPPAAGPAATTQVAAPKAFALPNGLMVVHSEQSNLPLVAMSLVVKTGSDANPVAKPGLANFTVAMLNQGTATRSALQLADDAAQLGTSITTTSSMDSSRISIRSLKKNAGAALDLLADVALKPSFPAEEIERQRGQRLSQIVARRGDPNAVGNLVMAASLFGPKHPYGFTELGTEAGVKGMTRDDMLAFWKQNFVPNNAALVVAGAITERELRDLATKAFGAWTQGTPVKPALGAPETTPAKLVLVDIPGAPQTQLRAAALGAARSTPDYPSTEVMNMLLGGLFTSRVNLNLREDKGFTYGAFSIFQYRKTPGAFFVTTPVRTDATGPSVQEIFKELARMQNEAVTPAELNLGRDSLVRSLPGAFETTLSTVGTNANLYVYDLGMDYYAKYPAAIAGVTPASIQDAAKRYLSANRFVLIAVGDRAKIEPQLRKLNLGAVEIRDADGNVKK